MNMKSPYHMLSILVGVILWIAVIPGDQYSAIALSTNFADLRNKHIWNDFGNGDNSPISMISQTDLILLQTLKEILRGPLKGRFVGLLIDGDEDNEEYLLYFLLHYIRIPLTLLAVEETDDSGGEQTVSSIYHDVMNSTANNSFVNDDVWDDLAKNASSSVKTDRKKTLYSGYVLLYVTDEISTKSLQITSMYRSLAGLVIISRNFDCGIQSLLQLPLPRNTKSVALLCPGSEDQDSEDFQSYGFRVYSWRPFQWDSKLVSLGIWSPSTFLTWNDLFVDRYPTMGGLTLQVASDRADIPFLFLDPEELYDGTSKRLMDALGSWMNFTYTLTPRAQDGRWGSKEDGVWFGMLGEVWRGEKNLTINSFAITRERVEDFDFSVSYYRAGFGFNVMEPPPLPRWSNLTYPLTQEVWIGIIVTLSLTAMAFCLLSMGRHRNSLFNCFLTITQGLIKQAVSRIPESWTLRLFLAFWWLGAYVIVVSYTCNLIAILTVPLYPPKLHSVQQLADSDYRLCMLDYGEFVPGALATSQEPNLFKLGSKLDLVPMTNQEWDGDEACVALVLSGDYAQVEFYPYMKNLYNALGQSGKIYSLREQIYESNMAFFFGKGTPWSYKFDQGIQRLVEADLVQKWLSDILGQRNGKSAPELKRSSDEPLSLGHLQGPFMIFAFGFTISTLSFVIEFFNYSCGTFSI